MASPWSIDHDGIFSEAPSSAPAFIMTDVASALVPRARISMLFPKLALSLSMMVFSRPRLGHPQQQPAYHSSKSNLKILHHSVKKKKDYQR
jgi:hypothetical protein